MPTLWEVLERDSGSPVSSRARLFLQRIGTESHWHRAADQDKPQVVKTALVLLQALRAARYEGEPSDSLQDPEPEAQPGSRDPRWDLWRDLRDSAGVSSGWQPFRASRVFDVSTDNPALTSDRVEISFDSRLSRRAVVASLEKIWPRLTESEWIRPTRIMDTKAADLLRLVCMENPPGTPWRELMAEWNRRYPRNAYKDVRAFRSRFDRAEEQLTGYKRGLDWFYDPKVREIDTGPTSLRAMAAWPDSIKRHYTRGFRKKTYDFAQEWKRSIDRIQSLVNDGKTIQEIVAQEEGALPPEEQEAAVECLTEWLKEAEQIPDDSHLGGSKNE